MEIISRDEAISQGLKRYFTGKSCIHGHITERHVIGRSCVQCKANSDKNSVSRRSKIAGSVIPPFNGVIISRQTALNAGFKYYFTRKECKNGHVAFRNVVNANCCHCELSYQLSDNQKEKGRLRSRQWARINKEKSREIKKQWAKSNPNKIRKSRDKFNASRNKKRQQLRRSGDGEFLSRNAFHQMTKRICKMTGKKKKLKTSLILGYNADHLKSRIEFQFKDGMSWGNYGKWHIDHKKPVSRFIKQGITDPKIINALSNLQPLWAKDNLKKSDKWIY